MNTPNIILWTTSLILAVGGIIFGITASLNSKHANEQLKKMMNEQMVSEEASKYFFRHPSSINAANRKIVTKLKKEISWNTYNSLISETRLDPLPKRVVDYLTKTDFKILVDKYSSSKKQLQQQFVEITDTLKKLSRTSKISIADKNQLIKYHQKSILFLSDILKSYYWIEKGQHDEKD